MIYICIYTPYLGKGKKESHFMRIVEGNFLKMSKSTCFKTKCSKPMKQSKQLRNKFDEPVKPTQLVLE